MASTTTEFDAAEYLDSPYMIATYLKAAFEENDAALIRTALNDVARAKGMTAMAAESKITRQALYKALGPRQYDAGDFAESAAGHGCAVVG